MKKILLVLTLIISSNLAFAQYTELVNIAEENNKPKEYILYYDNGNKQVQSFIDGNDKLNGDTIYYFENGNIQGKGRMVNNEMVGDWEAYDEQSGKLSHVLSFENDEIVSKKLFYENGTLKSNTPYVDGKIEGVYKEYYEDGTLAGIENYKNDLFQGESKSYHKNEELKHIGRNVNGKQEGTWKYYYDNGSLGVQVVFKNGEVVSEKKYKREEASYNEDDYDIFGSLGNSPSSSNYKKSSSRRSAEEIEKSGLLSVKDLQNYEIKHIESNSSYLGEPDQVLDFNIYTDSETRKLFFKIKHLVVFYDFAETQVSFSDVKSIGINNDKIRLDIKNDKIYFRNGNRDSGWNGWKVSDSNYMEILIKDPDMRKELYASFKYLVDHPYMK